VVDKESSQDRVPAELRDVSFPVSMRGYDRQTVDAYVERVNRVIAELEMSRSTEAAVRHALDRVGEQTSGILQRARSSAEDIIADGEEEAEELTARAKAEVESLVAGARAEATQLVAKARAEAGEILARSRAEAAQRLQQSEEEAAALREQADAWMGQLRAETEAISETRRKLLADIREMAVRFEEVASWAATRFPREPAEEAEGLPEAEVEVEPEPAEVTVPAADS
jgi:DivIVA domain-containing protein